MSTLDFEPFARIEELEARIEALEADVADRESLLLAAGKRLANTSIETLMQRLDERTTERDYHMRVADTLATRIDALEAALRENQKYLLEFCDPHHAISLVRRNRAVLESGFAELRRTQ